MSESAIAAAKAKYGRLVVAEVGGETLAFKPLNKAKIADLKKNITNKPEQALELSVNACEFCCVVGAEKFSALADIYPLAFGGTIGAPGVIDYLFELARGGAVIRTE